ncbi:MAG TPA: type II toxin-antitoxin system VapC family toxin [Thermoanaerobaculia bacterium]|nr:type II toxin-antitoxin system VapC family toxin [Thermoanaerobaculia bacterium]
MILFLDTSALVKLYFAEPGSERMRAAVARGEPMAVSAVAFAEIHATFARRRREELLQATELEQLLLAFAGDWEKLTQMPVGAAVLRHVPGLCHRHLLRGADAVHLASALLLREEGLDVLFACSDRQLLEAAAAEGLAIFDPAASRRPLDGPASQA